MEIFRCPSCSEPLDIVPGTSAECKHGHAYPVVDGILDVMPNISEEKNLADESIYWDNIAKRGWPTILPNKYLDKILFNSYVFIFQKIYPVYCQKQ